MLQSKVNEARIWVDRKVTEVEALRNGDLSALRRQDMPTLQALVDEYLAQHVCEAEHEGDAHGEIEVRDGEVRERSPRPSRRVGTPGVARNTPAPGPGVAHREGASPVPRLRRGGRAAQHEPGEGDPEPGAEADGDPAVRDRSPRSRPCRPSCSRTTGRSRSSVPHRPAAVGAARARASRRRPEGEGLHVRRVLIGGQLRPYGKTTRALRVVPLAQRALDALEAHPARIDTPLLFTTQRRHADRPAPLALTAMDAALRAAGLPHRGPYAMRHTFASWAIAAASPPSRSPRRWGRSLEQLSKTYAHLLPDSADRARVALDAYINQAAEATERAAR